MVTTKSKNKKGKRILEVIVAIILIIAYIFLGPQESQKEETSEVEGTLEMHMIDVGQADSILFVQDGHIMLVDCATASRGDDVVAYLKQLGIEKIDVLIGTHPHDDHMGGMAEVIDSFEIGKLYVPDMRNEEITTQWYMNFLEAVARKNKEEDRNIWLFPKDSTTGEFVTFSLGDAKVQFLAPTQEEYSNKNNYSIAMRVSYGETDIFLSSDAEELAEKEMIATGFELESEIMKAGHHGSNTSNSEELLDKVNPEYVMISAGLGNKYEHPNKEVVERFEEREITVYRTDEAGTVIMETDGENIKFNTEPGDYLSGPELEEKMEGRE